jgi:2-keto-4-pentenoate hydratase/2-oxohepta-3-ene-1,7-dioic acid hydratase in catechol pathway
VKLASFGGKSVGVVFDDTLVDVTALVPTTSGRSPMVGLIQAYSDISTYLGQAAASGDGQPLSSVDFDPPVPDPSKIVAAPVNYVDHMNEMSETINISSLGVFLKAPSSLIGSGGVIQLPYNDRRFDQEAELAVIIGRRARTVPAGSALAYVFGYSCLLDITMRGGEDRSTRKSFDTFTPMGPYLVTADEFGAPDQADLQGKVNDDVRQSASTSELIWGVAKLIEYVSSVMTLEPGDVIATGTPAGVGPITNGDRVEVSISRLGTLRAHVSDAGAVACPTRGVNRGPVPPPPPTP